LQAVPRGTAARVSNRRRAAGSDKRLFEAHLSVADLPRSLAFYRDVVGLPVALEVPERGAAFLWVGGRGRSMLGLWSFGSAPLGLVLHVAFAVTLDDLLDAPGWLLSQGVQPLSFFGAKALRSN
jgi:lactoylglutathione lyase